MSSMKHKKNKNGKSNIVDILAKELVWVIKTNPRVSEVVKLGNKISKKLDNDDALAFLLSSIMSPDSGLTALLEKCRAIDKKFDINFRKFQKKSGMASIVPVKFVAKGRKK